MKRVTKEEFYKVINTKDVDPHIVKGWSNLFGYKMEWRLNSISNMLIGITYSGGNKYNKDGEPKNKRFYLA